MTPEKRIPKKKKKIKSKVLSPFIWKKILLNEENDDNFETKILHYLRNTICQILVQMILLGEKRQKNTNDNDKYNEETSKLQDCNESVDN